MTEQHSDDTAEDPGTQPASFADLAELNEDSISTMRPMATQAVFRPNFDDDDDDDTFHSGFHTGDTEPQDQATTLTRTLSPTRRLGGGLVEIPRVPARDPLTA